MKKDNNKQYQLGEPIKIYYHGHIFTGSVVNINNNENILEVEIIQVPHPAENTRLLKKEQRLLFDTITGLEISLTNNNNNKIRPQLINNINQNNRSNTSNLNDNNNTPTNTNDTDNFFTFIITAIIITGLLFAISEVIEYILHTMFSINDSFLIFILKTIVILFIYLFIKNKIDNNNNY